MQAAPEPATPPSALQQGKASFVRERQGTLLRSRKLERRLPAREDGPSVASPSGKRPQGIETRKHPHQVSGQTGGSRVQPRPHVEASRQAMGSTAKTAVKERGVPVKSAGHPIRKTAGIGKPGGKPPARAFPARQARRAAEAGEPRAFFWAGYSYELGEGVPKDNTRATQYYQQALSAPIQEKVNPANRMGMCYYDGRGVERDYAKAFQLLKWAEDHGGPAMLYYLGACYANGQGTRQDYAKAFTYLDKVNWDCPHAFYLLGKMYCNGLGVPMDIAKGVEYLQKAGDYVEVKEELRHYKKTLFGKWVRR